MWTCKVCPATREKPATRLPRGWKRQGDGVCCGECWKKSYILRAVTLPIVSPVDSKWEDLNASLRLMWQQTTQAANWIVTELYARDVRRQGQEKMPPMPAVYLYPELRRRWPELPSRTVSSLEHAITLKYRATRFDVVWACRKSLPTFRYPVPFPVSAQGWDLYIPAEVNDPKRAGKPEWPIVRMQIGENRLSLRLHGGPRYRRQRDAMKQIISGEAQTGEAAVYKAGDNTMVKLVAWLPRTTYALPDATGILRVRTAHDCLLIALNAKDDTLWRYNGDHLVRWAAEHRKHLQRWSEDQKYEQRPVPSFADRRSAAAEKYHNRMHSACHEIAAQLANYAYRRKFAAVAYDDTERGFGASEFPYYTLNQMIQEKLDEKGIEFALAQTEVQPDEALVLTAH